MEGVNDLKPRWMRFLSLPFLFLPGWVLADADVDHFVIEMSPASAVAGSDWSITITAQNYDTTLNDYRGTVTITASSGAGTFFPVVSGNFLNFQWKGSVQLLTAGTIAVTCTGSRGATGTASVLVTPGAWDRLLMVMPGQTYTPGIAPGVSPTSVSVVEGTATPVTIYTVDKYYNWDPTYAGTIDLNVNNGSVEPPVSTGYAATNGKGFFTFSLNDSQTLNSYHPMLADFPVTVITIDHGYLHLQVPPTIAAGRYFSVTATASASMSDPNQILGSTSGMSFRLHISTTDIPPQAASGTWLPSEYFQLGAPNPSGTYIGSYSYDHAGLIVLLATKESAGGIPVTGIASNVIQVLPATANSLQVTILPSRIQAQHKARINVLALDQYGNPTNSLLYPFLINFQLTNPTPNDSVELLSVTQTATDVNGNAYCDYTGANENKVAIVKVSLIGSQLGNTITESLYNVQVSVAKAEPGSIVNYPNPFNPAQSQTTSINYYLPESGDVELRIYDAFGRTVLSKDFKQGAGDAVSRNATMAGGAYFTWDGKNGEGKTVANGIYLVYLRAHVSGGVQEFKRRVGVLK